jgi:Ti-type conjugative transfer relaxase TraA
VIDEAGMIGSRQLERVLREVREGGAKAVLLGDAQQLQPIEAGAAFRAVAERTGHQTLSAIQRQRQEWQREASREFAKGQPKEALARYHQHHAIHFVARRHAAKVELIHDWARERAAEPEGSAVILAHTRADVRQLNEMARAMLKDQRELGPNVAVSTSREVVGQDGTLSVQHADRSFAVGDRVMFLKNDRGLEVRNGSLGTVATVSADSMTVKLDADHRQVSLNLRDYSALDHGYATTIHKAQGSTVERAYVLATPGMDRHLAYVAMTRHRESAHIYAGHDDFRDFDRLVERLSRAALKDTTLDYAARRGLDRGERGEVTQRSRDPELTHPPLQPRELVAHFKEVQQEFIKTSGRADIDPAARQRTDQLRAEMKETALEISKTPEGHKEAEKSGIGGQVRDFVRQAEQEKERERGLEKERDRDLELER